MFSKSKQMFQQYDNQVNMPAPIFKVERVDRGDAFAQQRAF